MKYYSTNKKAPIADLHKAVVKGLAEDRGLYMPEIIKKLPQDFFDNIEKLSFQEIAYKVADAFFGASHILALYIFAYVALRAARSRLFY